MRQKQRQANDAGFTLVELIVVTGILGILAAIAIPQFASYKSRAVDAQMQSAIKNARTAMEAYFLRNREYTTDMTVLEASEYGYRRTDAVDVDAVSATTTDFHLRACANSGSFDAFEYTTTGPNSGKTIGVDGVSCTP